MFQRFCLLFPGGLPERAVLVQESPSPLVSMALIYSLELSPDFLSKIYTSQTYCPSPLPKDTHDLDEPHSLKAQLGICVAFRNPPCLHRTHGGLLQYAVLRAVRYQSQVSRMLHSALSARTDVGR